MNKDKPQAQIISMNSKEWGIELSDTFVTADVLHEVAADLVQDSHKLRAIAGRLKLKAARLRQQSQSQRDCTIGHLADVSE